MGYIVLVVGANIAVIRPRVLDASNSSFNDRRRARSVSQVRG